jgi:hypothetical protein
MQDIRDILHQQRERLHLPDEVEIAEVEIPAWIELEGFGVLRDLAELCATDSRICLAWRTTDKNIDGLIRLAETKFGAECAWLSLRYVTRFRMSFEQRVIAMEVQGMRPRSEGVQLYRRGDAEPRPMEAQADATASREQINDARTAAPGKALDLRLYSGISDQHPGMCVHSRLPAIYRRSV